MTNATDHALLLEQLESRHELSDEFLTDYIRQNFNGSLLSLRQLEPFVKEILRRFKRLPRKKGVDGQYKTIGGCTSFKKWAPAVLGRTDRACRYMLERAHSDKLKKPTETEESISAVSEQIVKYIRRKLDNLEDETLCPAIIAAVTEGIGIGGTT
jgi:hypothetical protein